jgi:hypothetical protein
MAIVLELRPAENPTFSTESADCCLSRWAVNGQKQAFACQFCPALDFIGFPYMEYYSVSSLR